jgi:glutamyl-tRNA reductase
VEPEVAELPDVYLYTIDDLTEIIEENIKQRRSAAESAEHLVMDGANYYIRERRAHQGQALLRDFRDNAESIQQAELQKALKALRSGADPQSVIQTLSRSLTNKLIHAPTVAVRDASADGRNDLIEYFKTLYRLD